MQSAVQIVAVEATRRAFGSWVGADMPNTIRRASTSVTVVDALAGYSLPGRTGSATRLR